MFLNTFIPIYICIPKYNVRIKNYFFSVGIYKNIINFIKHNIIFNIDIN